MLNKHAAPRTAPRPFTEESDEDEDTHTGARTHSAATPDTERQRVRHRMPLPRLRGLAAVFAGGGGCGGGVGGCSIFVRPHVTKAQPAGVMLSRGERAGKIPSVMRVRGGGWFGHNDEQENDREFFVHVHVCHLKWLCGCLCVDMRSVRGDDGFAYYNLHLASENHKKMRYVVVFLCLCLQVLGALAKAGAKVRVLWTDGRQSS